VAPKYEHLADVWEALSDAVGDAPALSHGGTTRSWRDFDERSARLASALSALGVGYGTVVAIDLFNCSEYLEAYFAVLKLRAVPANVNYRYAGNELRQLLNLARAEVLVVHATLVGDIELAIDHAGTVRSVIVVDHPDSDHPDSDQQGRRTPDWHDYEALIESHPPAARIERSGEDIFLSFTGGTTGLPKGVTYSLGPATLRSILTRDLITGESFPADEDTVAGALRLSSVGRLPVAIPASPLMHSTGLQFASFPTLVAGGSVVTDGNQRFDPHRILSAVQQHRATAMAIVGDAFARPLLRALTEAFEAGRPYDCSSLRCIASAGLAWSGDVKAAILELIPQVVVMEACGSTEGAHYGSQLSRRGDPAVTGRFAPFTGVKILDDERQEVPAGEIGRIAGPTVASGYLNDLEATAKSFFRFDGQNYVSPGDLGRIAEDGQLELLGRGTSVINRGGEKVFPGEVEQQILSHGLVEDALVIGVPDERFGQAVGAVVQVRVGAAVGSDALWTHLEGNLASYKVPRRIVFANVPRFPNGKPDFATATQLLAADDASTST
jgi:3-oxocholest-4-en-26-oate---CoA ligase